MRRMKYLLASLDGLIAAIAWEGVTEGHEVKLCITEDDSSRLLSWGYLRE